MAGIGPAPKPPDQRRRRNVPTRGEWQTLPLKSGRKAPTLPRRRSGTGSWSPNTRKAWAAWWADPAASQWTVADEVAALQLAYLFEEVEQGNLRFAGEVRQRMDGLGLTAKGKRDLRWLVGEPEEEAKPARAKSPSKAKLRIVMPEG